jgi:hypothetical protein
MKPSKHVITWPCYLVLFLKVFGLPVAPHLFVTHARKFSWWFDHRCGCLERPIEPLV